MRPEERSKRHPDPTNDPTKVELVITGDDVRSVVVKYRNYPGGRVFEGEYIYYDAKKTDRYINEYRKVGSAIHDLRGPRLK